MFTDKLYTGQREMAGLGIYHYGARFYSPKLGRFLSADTIVPGAGNPQAFNRYSYVLNNPLMYIDPSGHKPCRSDYLCKRNEERRNRNAVIHGIQQLRAMCAALGCGPSSFNGLFSLPAPQLGGTGGARNDMCDTFSCSNGVFTSGGSYTSGSGSYGTPTFGGDHGNGGLYSPRPQDGDPGGKDNSCTLTPSYLCQLSEEDQHRISNGQSYTVDVASSGDALNRIAAYGVLISLPTAIVGAPEWASLLVTYLGGLASGVVAKIPGTQAGDLTVSVGQAVGEEFIYGGHTYNTQVITNTYYIREGDVIWTQTDVTNAYPTSRTY